MRSAKQLLAMLISLLLCAPIAPAQDAQQASAKASSDVTIIIQQEQVRFTARSNVTEMQLQVFDQVGELVFDSGPSAVIEINWPLKNASGASLKSGLYAYTLTTKEQGAERARVRRGHFIVDRARDRDGKPDQLWVTSQSENGVGTELTVARDEHTTIAGTSAPRSEAGEGYQALNKPERDPESITVDKTKTERAKTSVAATGQVGQIAKFISTSEIGGSNITEVNGNVGVGTTRPLHQLSLGLGPRWTANGWGGALALENASAIGWKSNGAGNRFGLGQTNGGLFFFRTASEPGTVGAPANYDLVINDSGNVGIGITSPTTKLHVVGDETLTGNVFFGSQTRQMLNMFGTGFGIGVQTANLYYRSGAGFAWHVGGVHSNNTYDSGGGTTLMTLDPLGLSFGARLGQHLRLWSDNAARYFGIGMQAETLYFRSGNGVGDGFAWYKGGFHNGGIGNGHRDPGGGQTLMTLDGESGLIVNGQASVKALQITGGADFAENFDVNLGAMSSEAVTAKVEAGMVVSIDPENPAKLVLSTQAYDSQVAGIISGAGGVKPGMMMSQPGTLANGQYPVALSGRVYCWADASNGTIKPGDLLTTSSTPGHAMKVTDREKAQGAIIGKAMTGLKEGKGLVLVLVTLQ